MRIARRTCRVYARRGPYAFGLLSLLSLTGTGALLGMALVVGIIQDFLREPWLWIEKFWLPAAIFGFAIYPVVKDEGAKRR